MNCVGRLVERPRNRAADANQSGRGPGPARTSAPVLRRLRPAPLTKRPRLPAAGTGTANRTATAIDELRPCPHHTMLPVQEHFMSRAENLSPATLAFDYSFVAAIASLGAMLFSERILFGIVGGIALFVGRIFLFSERIFFGIGGLLFFVRRLVVRRLVALAERIFV